MPHTMGYRVPCHARSVACEYLEAKLEISREWQTSATPVHAGVAIPG